MSVRDIRRWETLGKFSLQSNHGSLDQIRGRSLDSGVHRLAFSVVARPEVGVVYMRKVTLSFGHSFHEASLSASIDGLLDEVSHP